MGNEWRDGPSEKHFLLSDKKEGCLQKLGLKHCHEAGVQEGPTLHLAFSSSNSVPPTRKIKEGQFLTDGSKIFALDQLV